tara:strand:- start:44 stop:1525 length:1482 start_codon:yes stop_codon:yes gene_type:complete
MKNNFKKILNELSYRVSSGIPDLTNEQHLMKLWDILKEHNWNIDARVELIKNLTNEPVLTESKDDDLKLLRNLGANESVSDEDLQDIIDGNVNLSGVSCLQGPGITAFEDKSYDESSLKKILSDDNKFVLTYSGNEKKLRTQFNVRICKWNNSKTKGDVNYKRIALMYKLIKDFSSKIEVRERVAAGTGYEDMQIASLNSFIENLTETPIPLFVDGEDTGVDVNGSSIVKGVPKADFTLDKNGTPVYWVSYKHGEYYTSEREVNAKVPFQQYGSMSSFYDSNFEKAVGLKGLNTISNPFLDKSAKRLKEKYIGVTGIKVNGKNVELTMGKKKKVIKDKYNIFGGKKKTFYQTNMWKSHKEVDIYVVPPKTGFYTELKDPTIIGATIYGKDFGKAFGKNNCNILLQAKEPLRLSPMLDGEGNLGGLNLDTTTAGHITFNPDIPKDRKVQQYLPVLLIRHTKDNVWGYKSGSRTKLFAGGRYLIMPKGNATGTKV